MVASGRADRIGLDGKLEAVGGRQRSDGIAAKSAPRLPGTHTPPWMPRNYFQIGNSWIPSARSPLDDPSPIAPPPGVPFVIGIPDAIRSPCHTPPPSPQEPSLSLVFGTKSELPFRVRPLYLLVICWSFAGYIAQEREKALKTGAPFHVFHFFPSTQDLTHGSLDAAYCTHPGERVKRENKKSLPGQFITPCKRLLFTGWRPSLSSRWVVMPPNCLHFVSTSPLCPVSDYSVTTQ